MEEFSEPRRKLLISIIDSFKELVEEEKLDEKQKKILFEQLIETYRDFGEEPLKELKEE